MRNKILIYLVLSVVITGLTATIASAGSIKVWGDNSYGQASVPAGNDFVAIATYGGHILAIKSDGSIVGWGANYFGQATPPAGNDFVAIAAGLNHSLALRSDGSIVAWGWNGYGQCNVPSPNTGFVAISAGQWHNLALRADDPTPMEVLDRVAETIAILEPASLKNKNSSNALTNRIDAVIAMLNEGRYHDALDKLKHDVLQKTNGCATRGQPDKNDWITTCEGQEKIYPSISRAIELVERLMR